jgi:hypothetical protein
MHKFAGLKIDCISEIPMHGIISTNDVTLIYNVKDARHPADSGFQAQGSWTIYGLDLQVNPTSISGYTGSYTFSSFLTIKNTGADSLTGFSFAVSQLFPG